MADKPKTFYSTLEQLRDGLGWTIVRVPFVPADTWKKMIRLRVRGTINGFAFRNSLFPFTTAGYFLLINRAMQEGARVRLGDGADFVLEPDLEPRPAELPDELATLLDQAEGLRAWYDALSESNRREIGKWIALGKTDSACIQRCEQVAERLLATMEAENELPPLIAEAFHRSPKARSGWTLMTDTPRRGELMAVFYYQSPEARARRLAKLHPRIHLRPRHLSSHPLHHRTAPRSREPTRLHRRLR